MQQLNSCTCSFVHSISIALHLEEEYLDQALVIALEEGSVEVKVTLLTMHGAPGSGKSSVKDLLLSKPPAIVRHSTPVATCPARAIAGSRIAAHSPEKKESITWEMVESEKLMEMLSESIMKFGEDRPTQVVNVVAPVQHQKDANAQDLEVLQIPALQSLEPLQITSSQPFLSDPEPSQTPAFQPLGPQIPASAIITDTKVAPDANPKFLDQEKSATAQRLLSLLSTASKSDRLRAHWIYMIDTGGQPQFQEVLPLFIRNNSINIITFRLCEKLGDKPKFEFVLHGKYMCTPSSLRLTNEELIQTLFRSRFSVKSVTIKHAKSHPNKPHFMIIGTFADKAEQCQESIEEKNQRLLTILEQYEEVRIDSDPANDEIIFAVNAITTEGREELAAWLRSQITGNEESTLTIDVPMRWFALELELTSTAEKKNRYVLTVKECERAGKCLQVKPEDLKHALVFFSEVAIFLYIPEVLPELVFVTKQPILNKVSDLFSLTFGDASAILKGRQLPPGSLRQLKKKGIFTKAVLRCLPEGFVEGIFMEEEFLKILVHLLVATPIVREGRETEYFIPCVLPADTLLEKEKQPYLKNASPLIITWDMEPIPIGLFSALVVSLLNSHEWPRCSLAKITQLRNTIRLSCSDLGGAVLLEDKHFWVEVCYSGDASHCRVIRTAILKHISEAQRQLHYISSPPQVGFPCTFCSDSTEQPHPCLVYCPADSQHPLGCSAVGSCRICSAPSSHYQITCSRDCATTAPVENPRLLAWLPRTRQSGKGLFLYLLYYTCVYPTYVRTPCLYL